MFQCNQCGRFISNKVKVTINGFDEIIKVESNCKDHGPQDFTDQEWSYEDFFPNRMEELLESLE